MLPAIETERLTLRQARPGMEGAMVRFLEENFAGHLERWSPPPSPGHFTTAFWSEQLALAEQDYRDGRALRLVLQPRGDESGEILGTCNYTNTVRGAFQACYLGYQIARARQGSGLMAEALRAANGYVFDVLHLHRIMANFRPENERSRRLLQRLGFVEEGLARDYLFIEGRWRDHVLASLTHPAYDAAWLAPPGRPRI